jgi:predicted MPP superfamily phosphohydrolase
MAPDSPHLPLRTRRAFLRGAVLGGISAAGVVALGGAANERHHPRVRRVQVAVPHLPVALAGLTICHLTDFHLGPLVEADFLHAAVATASGLGADVVVLTGDYLSGAAPADIAGCGEPFRGLQPPLGVYAVLGNHDYWCGDPDGVTRSLTAAGVRVLRNQAAPLHRSGAALWLVGVEDVWGGHADLKAALREVPGGVPAVLLCHAPDFADEAADSPVAVQLSGHTHGGQVRLPGVGPLVLPRYGRRYDAGLLPVAGGARMVYVNVGLGVIFPPLRLNCPPEIALLTLYPAA